MTVTLFRAAAFGAALALAGCASNAPETRVTRFHLGQPIATAQISVEPRDPKARSSLEFGNYAGAVSAELAQHGFVITPGLARSELIAIIDITRGTREALAERSPVSVGIGGGSFGGNVGVSGGISFPLGRPRSREIVATELAVQIKRRSEGTVIWEGRALTEAQAGSPAADPAATARRLAAALFKDFPGESGRTVTIK
ncbi:hypothetical protein CLG96_10085 [Sphingomonas oleivorans]|uniref:DUF4136 domain-containing protein n=1 Tax=Sphingomonas oleivorans TaxID=1735121 RepID=A0A2T5FX83_9SPHN|nr:DUF4136 domain-containing protein [Sphingomonas oleivorans]PTQ10747.1 hypothetical protein CLG96_10085 [Sphingomonas oleivorans]